MRVLNCTKVYSDGKHNGFTSVEKFGDRIFVAFRASEGHQKRDGVITLICSHDRKEWDKNVIAREGWDLRDPKLLALDGKLMLFTCGSDSSKEFHNFAFSSRDGAEFTEVTMDGINSGDWLWEVAKAPNGNLYGGAYSTPEGNEAHIYRSEDGGFKWQHLLKLPFPGNETAIDFDADGTMYALNRSYGCGFLPCLYCWRPPYDKIPLSQFLPVRLEGPKIKRLPGRCVLIGRNWDSPGRRNLRTDIHVLKDSGELSFVRSLPSGGDTSYAGWCGLDAGHALISYYSAHEHCMDVTPDEEEIDPSAAEHKAGADIFLCEVYLP